MELLTCWIVHRGSLSTASAIQITTTHTEVPASFIVTTWCDLSIYLLLAAALVAFRQRTPTPTPPRWPWLIALVVAVCGFGPLVGVLPILQPLDQTWLDWPGLLCLVWLVAALVPRVTWTLGSATAVALLALALRLIWLVYAVTQDSVADYPQPLIAGLVELTAVVTVGVPLSLRTGQRMRSETAAALGSATRS